MFDFADDSALFLADSPYTAVVGANPSVRVLYDAPFKMQDTWDTGKVESSAPACTMLDSDVARFGIGHNSALSVFKKAVHLGDFNVIGLEPDGSGLTRLILNFAGG